ncbi:MAG: bifunctional rhamnulose-1-phosphate aldolase/short-chain dehydrogenase [Candidatus Omnitrophica bacterium]|nr:bifunctional rhamnulose-1-phosphate aldolase/short-chain dehydrogenase [Candidatus Omnitrophota bacterium]
MKNLWNDKEAKGLNRLEQLVYRSRLIGSEPKLCVWGGGNTSTKWEEKDFQGRPRRVLRVKGSGSDLKVSEPKHFTPLDLDLVLPVYDRESMTDEDMVSFIEHCMLSPKAPRASIEALLHAFLDYPDIDHTHADAILAVTNNARGRELAKKLFGNELVWVPYVKPGFTLSKVVADLVRENPKARGAILEHHGLITWGEDSKESYSRTIDYVTRAEKFFAKREKAYSILGGQKVKTLPEEARKEWLRKNYPVIRGVVSKNKLVILRYDDKPEVLEFVNSKLAPKVSQIGPATPDHMLRTKRVPLFVDPKKPLAPQIETYAENHRRYYEKHKQPGMFMLDPYPVVILVPGIGMITTGKDAICADIVAEIYEHAIQVQKDASLWAPYKSLSEKLAFEMEYWSMELYKLSLAPNEKPLARKIALVTGAEGAIGRAIVKKLRDQGAQVIAADLKKGSDPFSITLDVTSEKSVTAAIDKILLTFGGIDILVSNAGIATVASLTDLKLEQWEKNLAVNATGHFLVTREILRIMRPQGIGGSIIFITTKNVLAPGKDFGAYSSSKSAQAQLCRIVAIENGEFGIRANMINPDGIFEGSGLWNEKVRKDRAESYKIPENELEDFYRKRNLLKIRVTGEDVAESVLFLASDKSAKTTGCILTVDGGVKEAFPR